MKSPINYKYLHRILDTIYKIHYKYNIPYENFLIKFKSDTGNQAEIKGTFYLKLEDRIKIHKRYLSILWKEREKRGIKQLRLW